MCNTISLDNELNKSFIFNNYFVPIDNMDNYHNINSLINNNYSALIGYMECSQTDHVGFPPPVSITRRVPLHE